jgi:hypothetical protein
MPFLAQAAPEGDTMSAGQIAAPHGRVRGPLVITLVVGAFAIGVLTGFGVPRTFGSGSQAAAAHGPAAQARTFTGVADNNMSDAARRAIHGPAAQARTFTGVADNNMSDAARRAIYGPAAQARTFTGVADNNMSEAARRAIYGPAAAESASAASRKAFHLTKTCVVVSSVKNQCEVTSSTFGAIPAGTLITYNTSAGPTAFVATISVKNGSATGQCDILAAINDAANAGSCVFESGIGRLTQFHLTVAVTRSTTADWNPWFWDGTYWFGGSD